jgi:hypothetical protein
MKPCSQEPVIDPCPELDEFTPHHYTFILSDPFNKCGEKLEIFEGKYVC